MDALLDRMNQKSLDDVPTQPPDSQEVRPYDDRRLVLKALPDPKERLT